jgi:5-methyltetrahydrofolate--homocysteine methyltransferase
MAQLRDEYATIRERHKQRQAGIDWLTLDEARRNRFDPGWSDYQPPRPRQLGVQVFEDWPLDDLVDYIDWTPYFSAWELAGRYPRILDDEIVGEEARKVFRDGQQMLANLVREKKLEARGVVGLFAANSVGVDDIEIYADDRRRGELAVVHSLRQQQRKPGGQPNFALADFLAPRDSGVADYLGAFAVCAGFGLDEIVAAYERDHDDYHAIMVKALADRLAEAFAERLHAWVRREFWGYAEDEQLDNEQIIAEGYRGIRPAPGYPACPDHTEKPLIWQLLNVEEVTGIQLTESFAMTPASAVCGFYFSHPASRYFGVGRINRDQVQDYARRKGMDPREAERWLAPVLGYEPE